MLNWLFKNRSTGRKDEVRSDTDLTRDRRNIGLWNNPVPDYSRVAPSPLLRNQARYLVANNAVAARAAQAFVDNVIGPGITLLPKIGDAALKSLLLKRWNRWAEISELGRLNDLDQFDRATLVKQKTGALLTGFITTPNENPLGANRAEDGTWTASLEPGTIQRLSPGESMEFSDPPETAGYADFAKTQLRLIASGLGLPYNVVTGDLSDTSYSSARVGLIEFRKYIDALQWQFIHMLCRPVFQRWVELEVLRGALPSFDGGVQEYLDNISWAPPAMQMTDPQREVDAMVRAIRAGLMSREMAVASLGYDLAEVDAQIAAGNAAADAAGIVLDSDPRKVTQQGNPATI
jgi:capsid protein